MQTTPPGWFQQFLGATGPTERRLALSRELERRKTAKGANATSSSVIQPSRQHFSSSTAPVPYLDANVLLRVCDAAFRTAESVTSDDTNVDVSRMALSCLKEEVVSRCIARSTGVLGDQSGIEGSSEDFVFGPPAMWDDAALLRIADCLVGASTDTGHDAAPRGGDTNESNADPNRGVAEDAADEFEVGAVASHWTVDGRAVAASRLFQLLVEHSPAFTAACVKFRGVGGADGPRESNDGGSASVVSGASFAAATPYGRVMSSLLGPSGLLVLEAWDMFETLFNARNSAAIAPLLVTTMSEYADEYILEMIRSLRSSSYISRRRMLRHVATLIGSPSLRKFAPKVLQSPAVLCSVLMLSTEDRSLHTRLEAYHSLKTFLMYPRVGIANQALLYVNRERLARYCEAVRVACHHRLGIASRGAISVVTAGAMSPPFAIESRDEAELIATEVSQLLRRIASLPPVTRLEVDAFNAACNNEVQL